jgi:hypothetical protein
MSGRRVVAVSTCGVVAVLGVVLVVLRWDDANKVAVVVSALAAVAAVGVGVWAAYPSAGRSGARVRRTGKVSGRGSNSGISGTAGSLPDGLRVDRSGDAEDGGNSGIRLT